MKLDLSAFENFGKRDLLKTTIPSLMRQMIFCVFKRYGIPVQVTDNEQMDLEGFLNAKFGGKVHVLNRIDQPVSGLVIFGKTREFQNFHRVIKNREVKNIYRFGKW